MSTDRTEARGPSPRVGVQLYSTKDHLGPELRGTLRRLAELGYTDVEPYDVLGQTDELAAGLAETGLEARTAHVKITDLDRDAVLAAARRLGIGTVVVPWVDKARFATADDVHALATEINEAAAFYADHGIRTGYHNHDFEFSSMIDGRHAWELLVEALDPAIVLQVDTYWASVGGADVFALIPAHLDRIRMLHVKNEPPDADDPPARVDITGRMDEVVALAAPALELAVVEVVVDGDVFAVLERNRRFFAELLEAT
ncbi:sugar phosphate isomerase/epimerase family protein [Pseudolysinimonas kribbensis]|uniref:sugar phosphate isomerase/epimerase family protein n=1 Tax=Pseudolysinimonas kribbensis TaxID=433641 RepID=UPI0024E0804F|nr:sugar phosphate isomerase/epimerase [Pseudolysinimonas kribbensis]